MRIPESATPRRISFFPNYGGQTRHNRDKPGSSILEEQYLDLPGLAADQTQRDGAPMHCLAPTATFAFMEARLNEKRHEIQTRTIREPGYQRTPSSWTACTLICSHLHAVTEGRIAHLIVNVPPGHAKSLLACVFWPAWVWIDHPESRWLFASHREALAIRDSLRCRTLIESDWYQRRWGNRFQLRKDQNQKQRFENDKTGYRVVVPMSAGTGERGDYVVVDDPHTVDQAESDAERTAAVEWWNGSMSTRLNDLSN